MLRSFDSVGRVPCFVYNVMIDFGDHPNPASMKAQLLDAGMIDAWGEISVSFGQIGQPHIVDSFAVVDAGPDNDMLDGTVNDDGLADFGIRLDGIITLVASDFIL